MHSLEAKLKTILDSTAMKVGGIVFVFYFILFLTTLSGQAVQPVDALGQEPRSMAVVQALQQPFIQNMHYLTSISNGANTYAPGNCTWFVKDQRPEIPNTLGNANTWFDRASAQGWATGKEPRLRAIATTKAGGLGHVAMVKDILPNNQVRVIEMNYKGLGIISERVTSASEFSYIY